MHSRHLNSPACKPKSPAGIPHGKLLVLFDGFCPFCQASVKLLKRLDWFNRLECKSFRDTANVPELQPPLSYAAMEAEMHAVSCCGEKVRAGFAAFRMIAWRLPLVAPFAPLLYLPGVGWIGQKAYLWVARNRFSLIPCKDGVCTLPSGGPQAGSVAGKE